jgi:cysteine desulfurase
VAVYLDHAADAPMVPAAALAMAPWLGGGFGNPSGSHSVARRARAAIDEARDVVGEFLGVAPGQVVFTSGGTEADNLAVLGALPGRPGAVVVSAVEHPAVTLAAAASGRPRRVAEVGADGRVDLDSLPAVLDRDVTLVSVQAANHETGVIQPLAEVAAEVRRRSPNAWLHVDAVQAAPWFDLAAFAAGADLITISGHKVGGPQGVGALGLRGDAAVSPILHGGGQEAGRRAGTQNVAAIVGLAAALRARGPGGIGSAPAGGQPAAAELAGAAAELAGAAAVLAGAEPAAAVARRRDRLAALVVAAVPDCVVTAAGAPRLPGHCHLRFFGVESESLLFLLDQAGVCASAGAACASGAIEPSPVLLAMGLAKEEAEGSLRLTLGSGTTDAEVEEAAAAVAAAVARLRSAG